MAAVLGGYACFGDVPTVADQAVFKVADFFTVFFGESKTVVVRVMLDIVHRKRSFFGLKYGCPFLTGYSIGRLKQSGNLIAMQALLPAQVDFGYSA